jgi:hypothetical protein
MGVKQDRINRLKKVCSTIAKISYSDLCSEFLEIHRQKLIDDTTYSPVDINIENRIKKNEIANVNSEQREQIKTVIRDLKNSNYQFQFADKDRLNVFANRIDFVLRGTSSSGAGLNNHLITIYHEREIEGEKISIIDLFNEIKSSNSYDAFIKSTTIHKYFLTSSMGFLSLLPYFYSVVKNSQEPQLFPLFYKQWQLEAHYFFDVSIFNYDAFCKHYRSIQDLGEPKLLHFSNYYYLLLLKLKSSQDYVEMTKEYEEKNKIDELIFVDRKDNISNSQKINFKLAYIEWLSKQNNSSSGKISSYIKAIEILSDILENNLFEEDNLEFLASLYDELLIEQRKVNGKFYYSSAPSYGKSGFYSASIAAYIEFLKDRNQTTGVSEPSKPMKTRVKNKLAQAICLIGASGVGKSYRIHKTLENEGHKGLFIILDNMWQHILFDYSPNERKYCLTKVGDFIKSASEDPENYYTIVFDECHKNLEIINDVLLQAISTKRNDGIRFLSLNSLVDKEFDFLPVNNGNRELPSNLGFLFVSSKSDIIEGNDDLKNRIEIAELTENDQNNKDYSINFLLNKVKKEEQGEYTN